MSSPQSDLLGRKIRYVKLHGGDAFVPGFGSLGNTLPPPAKTLNLSMSHQIDGLYVNINNGVAETLIPWANVQIAVYERAVPETAKVLPIK